MPALVGLLRAAAADIRLFAGAEKKNHSPAETGEEVEAGVAAPDHGALAAVTCLCRSDG